MQRTVAHPWQRWPQMQANAAIAWMMSAGSVRAIAWPCARCFRQSAFRRSSPVIYRHSRFLRFLESFRLYLLEGRSHRLPECSADPRN